MNDIEIKNVDLMDYSIFVQFAKKNKKKKKNNYKKKKKKKKKKINEQKK